MKATLTLIIASALLIPSITYAHRGDDMGMDMDRLNKHWKQINREKDMFKRRDMMREHRMMMEQYDKEYDDDMYHGKGHGKHMHDDDDRMHRRMME